MVTTHPFPRALTWALLLPLLGCPPNPFEKKKEPPPAPTVKTVSPPRGDILGGQAVVVRGENLDQATAVYFGANPATNLQPGDGGKELRLVTPAGDLRGFVTVEARGEGGNGTLAKGFEYVAAVHITSLDPPKIPADAPATVTIRGRGLLPPVSVTVGSGPQALHLTGGTGTETAVPVQLPALAIGSYAILATNGDNETGASPLPLEVTEPVRVTGVDPDGGFDDETVPITITGTGFTAITSVLLGTGACTNLVLLGETKLTCTAPTGSVGAVDVVVRRTPGDEGRLPGGFQYYSANDSTVRILYATPRACSEATSLCPGGNGDRTVDIRATGLQNGVATVTLANLNAPVVQTFPRYLRVAPPAYTPSNGQLSERVAIGLTVAGTSVRKDGAFTYYVRPKVFSLVPQKGATVGGDVVTITGDGFGLAAMRVTFSDPDGRNPGEATQVERLTMTRLSCKIPPRGVGMASVQAFNEFDQSELAANAFEYVEAVRVTRLDPPTVSIAGDTILEATGSGFRQGRMKVYLGDGNQEVLNPQVLSSSLIRIIMPSWPQAETVRFRVMDTDPMDPTLSTGDINLDYVDRTVLIGGVGGGSVRYNISVSVVRQDTGARVSGAEVFVGNSWANAGVGRRATTNQRGMAVLSALDLEGPLTLVAAAQGYENQARLGLDASEVTFALLPYEPQWPDPPIMAQVSGYVVNWAAAGYPSGAAPGQVKRLAVVYVSEPEVGGSPYHPGYFNLVAEEPCDITPDGYNNPLPQMFTVDAAPDTTIALMAAVYFYDSRDGVCAPGSPAQPNQEGEGILPVTAGAMGLLTDVVVRAGTNPNNNIPVNRTVVTGMSANLMGAPSLGGVGTTVRTVDSILDVGVSGVFTFFNRFSEGAVVAFDQAMPAEGFFLYSGGDFMNLIPTALPAPGGDLKYVLHGVSASPYIDEYGNLLGYLQPQSEVWVRNVAAAVTDLTEWFPFVTNASPGNDGTLTGRRFSWSPFNREATFVTVDIGELLPDGNIEPRWSMLAPGNVTEVVVPDLTGAPNVQDLDAGTNLWQLGAYHLFPEDGISYHDHTNDKLGNAHWRARTLSEPYAFTLQ